jgi:hypothetical protein
MNLKDDILFFFIDDQGNVGNNQKWLLLGGLLIRVNDYHNLSREIKEHNQIFLNFLNSEVREIKWSDLISAMYLKSKNQMIKKNKSFAYLDNVAVRDIENFIEGFFQLLNKYNYQIILSISNKDCFIDGLAQNFVKFQIEDLLERVQYEIQNSGSLAIFVHDSKSNKKDNIVIKNVYKSILSESRFVNDFKNIIDNLFIEDSHLNSGIQISDFIIGAISGILRGWSFSKTLYTNYLQQKLRKNQTGKVIGYGIVPTGLTKNKKFKNYLSEHLMII